MFAKYYRGLGLTRNKFKSSFMATSAIDTLWLFSFLQELWIKMNCVWKHKIFQIKINLTLLSP